MANRGLGTLTLSLIAQIGGFTEGLSKAERELDRRSKAMAGTASKLGKAIGVGIAAGATAAGIAVADWTRDVAKLGVEFDQLAKISKATGVEFQRQAAGAASVGIEHEKLADIFKDVQDRVGEFLQTGAGPMKDFFDNIAPKVGVTAEQFRKLSGPESLQLFADSLQQAKLGQQEMVFYLEAMASDSSKLIPLLKDGGRGMREMGDQAQALGGILSERTLGASKELKAELAKLDLQFSGLKAEVAEEMIPAIRDFVKQLNDPDVRDGFKAMAEGLGATARWAVETAGAIGKATGALREFFGENAKKSTVALQNRQDELWLKKSKLEAQDARGGGLFGNAPDPISKLLGLPSGTKEELAAVRKEMAEIDRILEQRVRDSMFANVTSGMSSYSPTKSLPKTGKDKGGKASGKSDAARAAEEALRHAQELADAQQAFHDQLLDLQASMVGPIAEANREYDKQLQELNAQFAEGKVTLADYATAQDVYAEKHSKAVEAIKAQKSPAEEMLTALQDELTLLGMTAEQQEVWNNLKLAGVDANSAFGQSIIATTQQLQQQRDEFEYQRQVIDDFKGGMADAITDFVTGAKSMKDAFKDFADDFAKRITHMIAQKWMDQLFSTSGSGGGSAAGGAAASGIFKWVDDLFTWYNSSGPGYASGGYTGAGAKNQVAGVVHKGEVVWSQDDIRRAGGLGAVEALRLGAVGGADYLRAMPALGRVAPAAAHGNGPPVIHQVIQVQGMMDRRTPSQIANESARAASRAMARR